MYTPLINAIMGGDTGKLASTQGSQTGWGAHSSILNTQISLWFYSSSEQRAPAATSPTSNGLDSPLSLVSLF